MAFYGDGLCGECFHFDYVFWDDPQHFTNLILYQIGEMCGERCYKMKPHMQLCNEITYVVSGKGIAYIDNGPGIPLQEGDIFVCSTGHEHTMVVDAYQTMRFLYLGFSFTDKGKRQWAEMADFYDNKPYSVIRDDHMVMQPFVHGLGEMSGKGSYSRNMIKNYLEQILILTYRQSKPQGNTEERTRTVSSSGAIVYNVIRYIEDHIFSIENVTDIADAMSYSYSYISHIFKSHTSISLQKYLILKRNEKALELLRFGNMSVTEVAHKLKYKTVQSFSKSFAHTMGYPPSQYKKIPENNFLIRDGVISNDVQSHTA